MENISSIQNSYTVSPELQKRKQDQENFTALDREKLKQDTVNLANKTIENANENWLFKKMKDFGVKEPKKLLKSVLYTTITVVGLGAIGNKLSSPTFNLGNKVDDVLLKDGGILNKIYMPISNLFKKGKTTLSEIPKHSKTLQDIQETVKTRPAKIKCTQARGYERGPVGIFIATLNDIFGNVKNNFAGKFSGQAGEVEFNKSLKKLVGDDAAVTKLLDAMNPNSSVNTQEFYVELTQKIVANAKKVDPSIANKSTGEILELLRKNGLKGKGLDVSDFINLEMKSDSIFTKPIASWWPVNFVNKAGKKVFGEKFSFCQGNLFDSLIKFNAINGSGAKTLPGKFIQKAVTLPTECISNFVNDKSGMGLLLAKGLIDTYNTAQDAPKEKKAKTVANDFATQVLHWALAMPISYAVLYKGIGSMKNLQGSTFITKGLKQVGKFFGMGLDSWVKENGQWVFKQNTNKVTGFLGGALRFFGMMFVMSPLISKQISKVTNKVFGKPYNKAEEEQKKRQEEQMKQIIPELGISQEELIKKLQNNPQAANRIQTDPKLIAEIQKNPKALVDILDGKDISNPQVKNNPQNNGSKNVNDYQISQANMNLLNKRRTLTSNPNTISTPTSSATAKSKEPNKATSEAQNKTKSRDTATYIPSSAPAPTPTTTLSNEQYNEYTSQMSRADKILAKAEKYI